MGKADGRLYGIGCALDVAGGRFAVLLVMIAFLLPYMYKKKNPNIYIGLLLMAFCLISVIGNMIGRTTSVGMVIGIVYMLSMIFSKQIPEKHDRSRYIFGVLSFLCITILVSATLYNVSDYWYDYFRFGFEGFFSLVEKGKWDVGFELDKAQGKTRFVYKGFVRSDDLIATAQGDFGLVWDGFSVDACTGDFGEYLKYNNPHKTSLYIRCELPVIIWDQAALAAFVRNNGIGICVASLAELDSVLEGLTSEQYAVMKRNVAVISERLSAGYYIRKALSEVKL